MNETKLSRFRGRYQAALSDHLARGVRESGPVARGLGKQAKALGLETLDLARLHEAALAALVAVEEHPAEPRAVTARAAAFFHEALDPLESGHALAVKTGRDLADLDAALASSTVDLANSRRALRQGVGMRKKAVRALHASEAKFARLLAEAQQLHLHLQELVRRILTYHEDERRKMSLALQEEIAQTLLAVHVRLLALKKEVSVTSADFQKKIAITQRMVERSVQTINRFTRSCL